MDFARTEYKATWPWVVLTSSLAALTVSAAAFVSATRQLDGSRQAWVRESQLGAAAPGGLRPPELRAAREVSHLYAQLNLDWSPVFSLLESARGEAGGKVALRTLSHRIDEEGRARFTLSGVAGDQLTLLRYTRALNPASSGIRAALANQKPEGTEGGVAFMLDLSWDRAQQAGGLSQR